MAKVMLENHSVTEDVLAGADFNAAPGLSAHALLQKVLEIYDTKTLVAILNEAGESAGAAPG